MTDAEKREAAHQFINRWMGRGNEDEDGRSYAVTVSFDGADMTTTILDVIECSSSSTFETALNATFGKHKAKEGVSAWIILDVMGGVGKGALIKK